MSYDRIDRELNTGESAIIRAVAIKAIKQILINHQVLSY